jgi:phosphopantothenoylcysteine decarboxylase/phosphopantothenate--cysteine ligase
VQSAADVRRGDGNVEHQHIFIAGGGGRLAHRQRQRAKAEEESGRHRAGPEVRTEPDILATVAARTNLAGHPYCVGFAAESENLVKFGADKREKKGIPLLVGNIGHHTFGQDDNTIILFDENGHTILPRADKLTLARQLISEISKRISQHSFAK